MRVGAGRDAFRRPALRFSSRFPSRVAPIRAMLRPVQDIDVLEGAAPSWRRPGRAPRLAAARGLWLAIGGTLTLVGLRFAVAGRGITIGVALAIATALAIGAAKAWFVLAPMGRRNAERIRRGSARAGWVDLYPPRTWAIAFGFMALGFVLRRVGLPGAVLGFVYVAAGSAMVLAVPLALRPGRGSSTTT